MGVPCVGAVIHDGGGRIVLIQRGHAPSQGLWSIPGGRIEPGESLAEATRREVREETGLDVVVGEVAGTVRLPAGDTATYDVTDFLCSLRPTPRIDGSPRLVAGDDAADARWVSEAELETLECSPGLVETLRAWRVWTRLADETDLRS
ncbi:MAG: NUDIX hydrolase [Nocardioidaceae bacterium]